MEAIHGKNIYEGFDHTAYIPDRSGWGGESEAFAELIHHIHDKWVLGG